MKRRLSADLELRKIQQMSREDLEYAYLGCKAKVKDAIGCIKESDVYIILEYLKIEKSSVLHEVLKILGDDEK